VSDRAGPAEWASILLVEDDGAVRGLVMAMLIQAGYEVISAASEEEALRLVDRRAEPLDLLLTDVVMPGLNGRELAEKLQARRPGLPVLYMSGYADDHVIRTGVLPAGSAFLAKPFSMEVLLRSVRAVLRARVNPPSPPN
jgi:two-component system cell cycle sensor histidine kinase/response regulator CckA